MIPDINLLPQRDRQSEKTTVLIVGLLIIWALILSFLIFNYFQTKAEVNELNNKVASLSENKAELESKVSGRGTSNGVLSLANAVSFTENLILPTSLVIDELFLQLPAYSYISEYAYNHGEVTVQSQFETLDKVAEYVTNLENTTMFSDVKVETIEAFQLEEEKRMRM